MHLSYDNAIKACERGCIERKCVAPNYGEITSEMANNYLGQKLGFLHRFHGLVGLNITD